MFTMMRWRVAHKTKACTSKVKVTLKGRNEKFWDGRRPVINSYRVNSFVSLCCYWMDEHLVTVCDKTKQFLIKVQSLILCLISCIGNNLDTIFLKKILIYVIWINIVIISLVFIRPVFQNGVYYSFTCSGRAASSMLLAQ